MPNFRSEEIYELEMYNRNSGHGSAYCDLLVTDSDNTIFVANIIATDSKAKQVAWLLQEGKTGNIHRAEGNKYETGHIRHNVYAMATRKNSYDEELMKIDDLTHIFMVAKQAKPDIKSRNAWQVENNRRVQSGADPLPLPDFLCELILAWDGDYRKQVYDVLNDRYNTPMLEEWADYIINALIERDYYEPLSVKCFGSNHQLEAGLLKLTEQQLEDIITEGIQGYELDFAIEEDGRSEEEAVLPTLTGIDSYLAAFGGDLGARIQQNIGLRFDPERDTHHPAFHDVNLTANEHGITGLYPPQANTVMGVSRTLEQEDFCFVIGEMG